MMQVVGAEAEETHMVTEDEVEVEQVAEEADAALGAILSVRSLHFCLNYVSIPVRDSCCRWSW